MKSKSLRDVESKSLNGSISCAYRGSNNSKCFIGCLIPDDLYDECIEDNGVHTCSSRTDAKLVEILTKLKLIDHIKFLSTLQDIHDYNFHTREYDLKDLAETHNLTYVRP